ncbi:hypothetical protein Zm00014a_010645 [Zea mays]|uniref:Uncharacterized protein n=1 Tax=Zea mays TaxID=4577 RepID=A0A3L6E4T6_MAIZE|nr:hypothetical protein Zm00014a_010645 [Zea mays]
MNQNYTCFCRVELGFHILSGSGGGAVQCHARRRSGQGTMSAVVCSKRSSSIFGDDLVPSPSSALSPSYHHHHHPAKRALCSPTRRSEVLLHHLFLDMDPQVRHVLAS